MRVTLFIAIFCSVLVVSAQAQTAQKGVSVIAHESERRVDVFVDGQLFTSYIWPETMKKPVLYPLRTAQGVIVTRGYPLEPRAGERVDHPHHAGLWFNYGDVNEVDFWNNSVALSPDEQRKMGTIVHRRIIKAESGKKQGILVVAMDWVMPDGRAVLSEETKFVFYGGADNYRAIDRITLLRAGDGLVRFKDNKEGLIGMRVARWLEHPADKPETFTDANGKPTAVAKLDNTGTTGQYRTSEGKEGNDAWGTRAKWAMLSGRTAVGQGSDVVTLAILDHPNNPGYPTYWHARGYGLFGANPLGQKIFSNGREELNFTLQPHESVTFRYRVLILSGATTPAQIDEQAKRFVAEVK
jgi:hypothetical protein